jgi:hypothetical protein
MPDTTDLKPTPVVTEFPQQIEVTFTLVVEVNDQEGRDYWLEPGTTKPTLNAIADMMDMACDSLVSAPKSVNGLTYRQIEQAMSEREV